MIDLETVFAKGGRNSLITGSISRKTNISAPTRSTGLREDRQTAMSIEIFRKLAVILKTDAGTLLGKRKEEEKPSSV